MPSVSIKSLAREVGSKGLDFIKQGKEIPLKVSASGVGPDEVVKIQAEGSYPDFSKTVGNIPGSDLGNVSKKFSVPFDFPGGEDVRFTARINDAYQSSVYKTGTETSTETIYSEADEKIKNILEKAKNTMSGENSNSSSGTDSKNSVKNLLTSPKLVIPVVAVVGVGISMMRGDE